MYLRFTLFVLSCVGRGLDIGRSAAQRILLNIRQKVSNPGNTVALDRISLFCCAVLEQLPDASVRGISPTGSFQKYSHLCAITQILIFNM
jgi:hypothetical protein